MERITCSETANALHVRQKQGKRDPTGVPDVQCIRFQLCIQNRFKLTKKLRKRFGGANTSPELLDLEARNEQLAARVRSSVNPRFLDPSNFQILEFKRTKNRERPTNESCLLQIKIYRY